MGSFEKNRFWGNAFFDREMASAERRFTFRNLQDHLALFTIYYSKDPNNRVLDDGFLKVNSISNLLISSRISNLVVFGSKAIAY